MSNPIFTHANDSRFDYARSRLDEFNTENFVNIADVFDKTVSEYASRTAFTCFGKDMSFSELDKLSEAFGAWLLTEGGLQKGDRIAIQMPNLLQYPVAAWGVLRAGLILVNTNPMYTERELEHQFNDSGAKAVLMLDMFLPNAEKVIPNTGVEILILTNPMDMLSPQPVAETTLTSQVKVHGMMDILNAGKDLKLPDSESLMSDVAILQYTGGTTGVAKGAMLTHTALFTYVHATTTTLQQEDPNFNPDIPECFIAPLPIYHIFGFSLYVICNMVIGGRSVLIPKPSDLEGMMDVMAKERFTNFSAVNSMFVGMLQSPKFDSIDWSSNRSTITGGAALVPEIAREWEERTGSRVHEGYGLSETTATVTFNSVANYQLGTVGRVVPGLEVKLVDTEGNEVAHGERGELVVRGPQVMVGYWNRVDATDESFNSEGFFHTGDVAVALDGGYYKIVDRLKDMVLVSGFNVYPNEIEHVVYTHPDVIECAVIGRPDEKSGEKVYLYVVSSNPELTEQEMRDFCRTQLTGYKVPKVVRLLAELPKSNVGKILRRELRDEKYL